MRRIILGAALLPFALRPLVAQCPDGTPPPCSAAPRQVAVRPANPQLDDRNWIVVPFDNLARSAQVEWLRDASVNLLSLDLSRWSDIRVVDDKRVSDLVRELPRASATQLSLNDGLSVARRAGAGRLVMGEVLRLGNRTTVQARVINVRDGQRIRIVKEEAPAEDSLMAMFGRLAERVLDVVPPPGANVGAVGTSRADAYQEYLAGVRGLFEFQLPEARRHLEGALKLDSTFALAHLGLALLIGWENPTSPERQIHARAAERFGGTLPPRERALIGGLGAFYDGDYPRSCDTYARLVKADSSDVLALYGLGDCAYHDTAVIPMEGDSTRMRFRGDWNVSIRAFRRAIAVDPGFHLAFQHILDAFSSEARSGCVVGSRPCLQWGGVVRAVGDSLVIVLQPSGSPAFVAQFDEARRTNQTRTNLEQALRVALDWNATAPPVGRAHTMLGHIYLGLGRFADAARELDRAGQELTSNELATLLSDRIELAVKQWDPGLAKKYYDSVTTVIPPGGRLTFLATYGMLFGRFAGFDSLFALSQARVRAPPALSTYSRMFTRVVLGVFPDNLAELEAAAFSAAASLPNCNQQCQADQISLTLTFALRVPRTTWPDLAPGLTQPAPRTALAVARRDTMALREAIRALDSDTQFPASSPLLAADALLWLGDSLAAYQRVARVLDTILPTLPLRGTTLIQLGPMAARSMVLRGDLAAALGRQQDAKIWYGRFLAFWAKPDPEFAPFVDRVRKAYAAAGGT